MEAPGGLGQIPGLLPEQPRTLGRREPLRKP